MDRWLRPFSEYQPGRDFGIPCGPLRGSTYIDPENILKSTTLCKYSSLSVVFGLDGWTVSGFGRSGDCLFVPDIWLNVSYIPIPGEYVLNDCFSSRFLDSKSMADARARGRQTCDVRP